MASWYWRSKPVLAICALLAIAILSVNLRARSTPLSLPRIPSSKRDILDDVFNHTLGFQKIYVISLPYRTDQQDTMVLAASLTGLDIEFVDGVTEVGEKALPAGAAEVNLNKGSLNAWRAHMNVARKIVKDNITSALVLEGDIDWDVRIKSQMRQFALASRLLLQPVASTDDRFYDKTFPIPSSDQDYENFEVNEATRSTTVEPSDSPYGDLERWDLLWLGHCGACFPTTQDKNTPLGRAVIANDASVPEPQHLDMQYGNSDLLVQYPPHTRVVSRARGMTCTLAYAVSQAGAKRLLYELSVHRMTGTNDMMFRSLCHGSDGREQAACLTVQPQLFQHFRPAGSRAGFSDINDFGTEENTQPFSRNIRWSTRLNYLKLMNGKTDYLDLYEDGQPRPSWLTSI